MEVQNIKDKSENIERIEPQLHKSSIATKYKDKNIEIEQEVPVVDIEFIHVIKNVIEEENLSAHDVEVDAIKSTNEAVEKKIWIRRVQFAAGVVALLSTTMIVVVSCFRQLKLFIQTKLFKDITIIGIKGWEGITSAAYVLLLGLAIYDLYKAINNKTSKKEIVHALFTVARSFFVMAQGLSDFIVSTVSQPTVIKVFKIISPVTLIIAGFGGIVHSFSELIQAYRKGDVIAFSKAFLNLIAETLTVVMGICAFIPPAQPVYVVAQIASTILFVSGYLLAAFNAVQTPSKKFILNLLKKLPTLAKKEMEDVLKARERRSDTVKEESKRIAREEEERERGINKTRARSSSEPALFNSKKEDLARAGIVRNTADSYLDLMDYVVANKQTKILIAEGRKLKEINEKAEVN